MRSTKTVYLGIITGFCIMFGFLYCIYGKYSQETDGILAWIYSSNIRIYIMALLLFFIGFFSVCFIGQLIEKHIHKSDIVTYSMPMPMQIFVSFMICMFGFGLFTHWGLIDQFTEAGVSHGTYDDFPMFLNVLIMLLFFSWMIYMFITKKDINNGTLALIGSISLLVTFMSLYIVNPFCQIGGANNDFTSNFLWDNTSVTETIYNVIDGTPFTYHTSGLYGHYAIFFVLPVKLLGTKNPYSVMALLGGVGVLAQLAIIYIIHSFDIKKWIKAILILAAVIRTSFTYPAISPIRTLFPCLICAYMTYVYNKKVNLRWNTKWVWIGFALCSCAVLWNLETGIGCVIGFVVFIIVSNWMEYRAFDRKMFPIYLCSILFAIGSVIIAIIMLNIYNMICGARFFVFRSFFYPYIGSSWVSDALRCNVVMGNHAWAYILILLLSSLSWALYHTRIFRKNTGGMREAPLVASLAAVGIIVFVYYFNEAHWGCMEIVQQISVALSAIIIAKLWPVMTHKHDYCKLEHQWFRAVIVLAVMVYSVMALQIYNDPVRIQVRHDTGAYSLKTVFNDLEKIEAEIPDNTYGIGQGINIIYHMMGWTNHARFRDTSAIKISDNYGSFDAMIREVTSQDSFLINESNPLDNVVLTAVLEMDSSYEKQKEFVVGAFTYGYYKRR